VGFFSEHSVQPKQHKKSKQSRKKTSNICTY